MIYGFLRRCMGYSYIFLKYLYSPRFHRYPSLPLMDLHGNVSPIVHHLSDTKISKECRHFIAGTCTYGVECRHLHLSPFTDAPIARRPPFQWTEADVRTHVLNNNHAMFQNLDPSSAKVIIELLQTVCIPFTGIRGSPLIAFHGIASHFVEEARLPTEMSEATTSPCSRAPHSSFISLPQRRGT
jgi:hypothetical protein